ncbi:MAG: fused MFS/spermidine synthase [Lachnospiraceae bacterium]|jgi:spermidine synthase|nr:fused MFS/spermidine synthase [Lachnospiraceae bacterium]
MKEKNLLHNKYFLYVTEFFSGMSVMAVELGASRLMAPYFSSSQIVWTVIIGVIMIAMALGNVWGGRIADKNPSPDKLYGRLLLAAVWIALIPFVGRYLIAGISLLLAVFITKNFLVWAALFACLAVFAFPCILLGTVTPSLVKYSVNSLEDNGKTVGELGALNTIGSIIGTFLPTFVTIPAVGTAITFLIFSGVLAAISILYFLSIRKKLAACALAVCLILALGFTSSSFRFAFWENDITLEDESIYNYLQVQETDRSVILSTNVLFGVQSILMKNAKLTGMYYDYALAAPFLAGLPQKDSSGSILVLGLGTGTFAKYCSEYFKDVSIEGVEIDEKIAKLATEYFDLPESVDVSVYDGRSYLAASEKKYDVIMVDAYQDITIPFQMSSVEFFSEVQKHLTDNGVMVVNMNMKSKAKNSINDYLCDTIGSVFQNVYTIPVQGGTNCEVFAFQNPNALKTMEESCETIQDDSLKDMMQTVLANLSRRESGTLILTDDKAPVEVLGMRVLDEIIADELDYYRDLYLGELF